MEASDLTKLQEHVSKLAASHGFIADVKIVTEVELPGSRGEPYIRVWVHNMSKVPPLSSEFSVRVQQFERGGVHVVDLHMQDIFRALSAC